MEATPDNARRVMVALHRFGAPLFGLQEEDLAVPGKGLMMGAPPRRIDILTQISGIDFAEAWSMHAERQVGGIAIPFIGLQALLQNKRASGRAQDLADVERLENGPD